MSHGPIHMTQANAHLDALKKEVGMMNLDQLSAAGESIQQITGKGGYF